MKLAILEGKWFEDKNISIENLFHMLGDLMFKEAHPYYYHMFDEKNTFSDLIYSIFRKRGMRYLYVAAHGSKKGIHGTDSRLISRTAIRNSINRIRKSKDGKKYGSRIDGVFFGSCNFLTEENARYLLNSTDIKWVAGYSEEVDWIDSSMIDLVFWKMFFENKELKPIRRIKNVCDEFSFLMPMYVDRYQFNLYVRRKGIEGEVISCFADLYEMFDQTFDEE